MNLFLSGDPTGVQAKYLPRIRKILALFETAESLDDMNLPGLHLHALKGKRKSSWSVRVSSNWRITFQIKAGDIYNVDLEDYH